MRHKRGFAKYIAKRLLGMIPLILVVTAIVFLLLSFAPGDPAELMLGVDATPESIAALRDEMGLNLPVWKQFVNFLLGALKGDLGNSFQSGRPVIGEIMRVLPVTVQLSGIAIVIATLVGVMTGVVSAVRQYSWTDSLLRILVLAGVSMPTFWLGLMLMVLFSGYLHWLPSSGWGSWQEAVLPCITLSVFPLAVITRMTRSSMLEVVRQDYVRTAMSKGLGEWSVILRHALPNAFIPVITVIGLQFGVLLAGAVIVETVFAIPGLGQLTVVAVFARDYPLIRASIILAAALFSVINLLVDITYAFLNPRIRY